MKTAEEWYNITHMGVVNEPTLETIKQIQLDTFKAGMTEAATLVRARIREDCSVRSRNVALDEAARDVLSARDRKERL